VDEEAELQVLEPFQAPGQTLLERFLADAHLNAPIVGSGLKEGARSHANRRQHNAPGGSWK
jgi:hypothetical protein